MFLNTALINSIQEGDEKYIRRIAEVFDHFIRATQKDTLQRLPLDLQRVSRINPECHTIAAAISMVIPEMKLKHGLYVGLRKNDARLGHHETVSCPHSWNVTPGGMIVDSYPVGVIVDTPLLVVSSGTYQPFGSGLYLDDFEITAQLDMFKIWNRAMLLADIVRFAEKGDVP